MKLFTRKPRFNLSIDSKVEQEGVSFQITVNKSPVNLPIRWTVSELKMLNNLEQLQLIEELFMDEKLMSKPNAHYLLSFDDVYALAPEERKLLHLPKNITPISLELENESFVGSKNFKFVPIIHSDTHPNLHIIGNRTGPFIQLPSDEFILIPKEHYQFLQFIDEKPQSNQKDELFQYIAKVKKQANILDIPVSEHIERENYEFIDDMTINVENHGQNIELVPKYIHDNLAEKDLDKLSQSNSNYLKVGHKRIFVDRSILENSKKIKQIPKIEGQDIPNFVKNPYAFIPDEIDISLEDFGERVKSLGIRVYKAQPFVHANKADRGWFDFETGYSVRDDEGNIIATEEGDFFRDIVLNGDSSVNYKQINDNTFVEIPEQAQVFEKLTNQLKQEAIINPVTKLNASNYILEIFENIDHVEYNQPLIDFREALIDKDVLDSKPPALLNAELKPFQLEGFKWMKLLRFTGNGGLLADDMGLGKTVQVIAFLTYLKERNELSPSLIVMPKSLIYNWYNELHKFAPELLKNTYIHIDSDRSKNENYIGRHDIVLTTYQTLVRDQLILGKIDWEIVICDEAQQIKNPTTATSVVVKALKNKGRLALTGTPVENNLTELWSIVDFVQPGTLGSLSEFKKEYESKLKTKNEKTNYYEIQSSIETKLRFIYKRRTKSVELKGQLPNKYEQKSYVALGHEQKEMYLSIIKQITAKEMHAMNALTLLKQLCSHPALIDNIYNDIEYKKVPKLDKTVEMLKKIQKNQEKVLIFTEYHKMQFILRKTILEIFELDAPIINGTTPHRQTLIDEFNQSIGFHIMILSPRAAGTGLTITSANHVIHYTRWWNPAVENQATDRVYRIGQDKDVYVYYPIVKGSENNITVEEVIDDLLQEKNELTKNIIVPSKDIDTSEVLLRLGLH